MNGKPVCAGCERRITGYYVQALGRNWHPNCFRCAACDRPIEGQYAEHNGTVYHPHCHQEQFGLRCAACNSLIEGQYVDYEGRPYHPDCHEQQFGKRCAVYGEYFAYLLHQEQTSPAARYCIHLLQENPDPVYDRARLRLGLR